jgi:DNA-directed RNA polymerase specialized sigma24 family protein
LPEPDRVLLALRYVEGFDATDIGRVTGIADGSVSRFTTGAVRLGLVRNGAEEGVVPTW